MCLCAGACACYRLSAVYCGQWAPSPRGPGARAHSARAGGEGEGAGQRRGGGAGGRAQARAFQGARGAEPKLRIYGLVGASAFQWSVSVVSGEWQWSSARKPVSLVTCQLVSGSGRSWSVVNVNGCWLLASMLGWCLVLGPCHHGPPSQWLDWLLDEAM